MTDWIQVTVLREHCSILLHICCFCFHFLFFFFFNDTATTEIYTLSLHDALPILGFKGDGFDFFGGQRGFFDYPTSSNGFIDNDPNTIIDIGVGEIGYESNYSFFDFIGDFINGTRDYFRNVFHLDGLRNDNNSIDVDGF